jgi:uncharacterized protein YjbI with pentapeptide repeats
LLKPEYFAENKEKSFPLSNQANKLIDRSLHQHRWNWSKLSSLLIIPVTATYFILEPAIRGERIEESIAQIRQKGAGTRATVEYMVRGCSTQRVAKHLPDWLLEPLFGDCISLSGYDLHSAILTEANLSSTNLSGTDLSKANLGEANLNSADLNFANLNSASLRAAVLTEANLTHVNFSDAILMDTNLISADLSGANLSNANLSNAVLNSAFLILTDLSDTNLSDTNLNKTIILATDLSKTKGLTVQQFTGESSPLICNSRLPEGLLLEEGNDHDCDQIPAILQKRHPDWFTKLEQAEAFVERQRQKDWE